MDAVQWQADHFEEIPVLVDACLWSPHPPFWNLAQSSYYGSIYPAIQNLLLAARAAGLGAALITLPLWSTWIARRILGLPWNLTPCSVIPLGWPRGRYGPTHRRDVADVVYSVSSTTTFPSIRYTGRLASDAPGTLRPEVVVVNGQFSQNRVTRWGDYSSMNVDPVDGCTLWYTNEFVGDDQINVGGGTGRWATQIASFAFPECFIRVTKDYRFTDVCFEKDDANEDPGECPGGTDLGTPLPTANDRFLVEAVVLRNGKIPSYNPGQYYAVSTVEVLSDAETLTIEEDFSDCLASGISALNPPRGGGAVVIVVVGSDGVARQILDAQSGAVTVAGGTASAQLTDLEAGTTVLMYVKFRPALKRDPGLPVSCDNTNAGIIHAGRVEADATLTVVRK